MRKLTIANRHDGKSSSDAELIRKCLRGHAQSWSALIDRYKNLIFSVSVRTGVSRDDSEDIFQAVCLELLLELSKLRHPEALPRWLVQVTYHKCLRLKMDRDRYLAEASEREEGPRDCDTERLPDRLLYESERSQKIRQVLFDLDSRCRQLIEALFFDSPARPYHEVARHLGLAAGSIGPIRERCLERVKRLLDKAGLGE